MFTTPISFASMVFICTTVGAGAGMVLSRFLPEQQLSPETKDIVRLAMGLVLTMTALVLGLVTASAKSTFDAQNMAVRQGSANVLTLDRMLAQCGPDANDIRKRIKQVVAYRLAVTWPQTSWQAVRVATTEDLPVVEDIQRRIVALVPNTEEEKWYKGRALEISNEIFHARWLTFGSTGASVSWAFLAVLTFWLTAIFLSFGLFAPRNVVVGGVILISALSVAGAVFLIMEMDDPFTGLLKVSGESTGIQPVHAWTVMKEDPCAIGVLTWLTCSDDADLPELSRPCDSRLFDRWAVRARLMSAPGLMVAGIWTRPMVMGFLLGSAIIARPPAAVVAPCAVIVMPPAIRDRLHGIDSNLINADGLWLRHGCQSRARWKGKQARQSKCECYWPRHFSDDPKLMKKPAHYSVTSGNGTVRSV